MQHHGVPTPLLDWSESFACALYFASEGWESNSEAAVYMMYPQLINDYSIGIALIGSADDPADYTDVQYTSLRQIVYGALLSHRILGGRRSVIGIEEYANDSGHRLGERFEWSRLGLAE